MSANTAQRTAITAPQRRRQLGRRVSAALAARVWLTASLAWASLLGCEQSPNPASAPAPGPSVSASAAASALTPPAPTAPTVATRRRTTSAEIAVRNLDKERNEAAALLRMRPTQQAFAERLYQFLSIDLAQLGRIGALDAIAELGEGVVKAAPDQAWAYRLRARCRMAAHRFEAARADLDEAEKRGDREQDLRVPRATLAGATGDYAEAARLLDAALAQGTNHDLLARKAYILGLSGESERADQLFQQAYDKYIGVSPFVVADILFQRGMLWERAEKPERAVALYREALAHLPQHAHAAAHLAGLVTPQEAQALLERAARDTSDPEYDGRLAALLNRTSREAGKQKLEQARAGYETLLKRHPAAFADHAAWFYLDVAGDAARARELAKLNLEARRSVEAYELWVAALLASGDAAAACAAATEAEARGLRSPRLTYHAERARERCKAP